MAALPSGLADCAAPPVDVELVPSATMAFCAVLGVRSPAPFATDDGPVPVHPLQPIAVEWQAPLVWPAPWQDAWVQDGGTVVHAWHDVELHRTLSAPERLRLEAEVVGVEQRAPGALTVVRYRAHDDVGPVWTTHAGVLWRGLTATAEGSCPSPLAPRLEQASGEARVTIDVQTNWAHVYSAASGIWNPIHTDRAVARAVGLPAPILHGSGTLGLAVTRAVEELGRSLDEVRQVGCRFVSVVVPPDRLTVSIGREVEGVHPIEVQRGDGEVVVRAAVRLDAAGGAT